MAKSYTFNPFTGNFDVISAVTLTPVGSNPNADGASIDVISQALTLQPADGTNPGLITAGTQTIGGAKTFNSLLTAGNGFAVTAGTSNFGGAVNITGGNLDMGSHAITSLLDPTSSQQAATKNYVDLLVAGIYQIGAKAATTANIPATYANGSSGVGATLTITATGALVIDGYTAALIDRILVKNQTAGLQNGVYVVTTVGATGISAVLTRATDYDTPAEINGSGLIPVTGGSTNATTSWQQVNTITAVGTDALAFTEFSANPSLYLLKSNNLSDVASATTAFNNISPITTIGDLIYGSAASTASRLGIGSTGNVLTVSGGLPVWASNPGSTAVQSVSVASANGFSGTSSGGTTPALTLSTTVSGLLKGAAGALTPATSADLPTITLTGDVTGSASGGSITTTYANTVPATKGGTGQTTYAVGDILYASSTTALSRLAAGTSGQFLKTQGSGSAPVWAIATAAVAMNVTSKTAAYTAVANDYVIASGAGFIITLPTAVGISGQQIAIQHNGTSLTQSYTLNTTSSQTIGGIASGSYVLNTNSETLLVVSDGANWQILQHKTSTGWIDGGTITITATTTSPTKAGSPARDKIWWMRQGSTMFIRLEYDQGGSGNNGNGDYLFANPGGVSADTTVMVVSTTIGALTNSCSTIGNAFSCNGTPTPATGTVQLFDAGHVRLATSSNLAAASYIGSGFYGLGATNTSYAANYSIAVVGWQP